MKKICIFDLAFMQYKYQSRAHPGMFPMVISGYHKQKGDQVHFVTTIPHFANFDIVYINRDAPDLLYDPEWLQFNNVSLVGGYWPPELTYYMEDWEYAEPDITIYHDWVDNRLKKYPSLKPARFEQFYFTPFKMIRGSTIVEPEGVNLIIIDDNLQTHPEAISILAAANITNARLAYNLIVTPDNVWEVFEFLSYKTICREGLSLSLMDSDYPEVGDIEEVLSAWIHYKMGRRVRLQYHVTASTDKEWNQKMIKIIYILERFKIEGSKRIYIEPHNRETYSFPTILTFLKRWTGKDMGYAKNSLIDYLIYDTCKTYDEMEDFLANPLETKKKSLQTLVSFLDRNYTEEPELIKALTRCRVGKFG